LIQAVLTRSRYSRNKKQFVLAQVFFPRKMLWLNVAGVVLLLLLGQPSHTAAQEWPCQLNDTYWIDYKNIGYHMIVEGE
jgi:hypothetical protein